MNPRLPFLALLLAATAPAQAADVTRGGLLATGPAAWDSGDGSGLRIEAAATTDFRLRALRAADDTIVSFAPLWQSFRFAVRDDRPRASVAFESAFRGGTDFVRGGFRAEVLHVYVDLQPAWRWGTVRIGRQIVATSGGSGLARIDGVRAWFALHRVGVEAFAGVELRSRAFVDRPPGPGETVDTVAEPTWGRDFTWGVAAFLAGHKATQLRLGVQDRLRDGKLSRRSLTLDASQGIKERVTLRFALLADLLQRRVSELRAGVDARPVDWLGVGFGYERWRPSFDAGELFSVFATDAFDSVDGRVSLRAPRGIASGWVSGGVEVYPEAITIDQVPRDEVARVASVQRAGVSVAPARWLAVRVEERLVSGVAGLKAGVSGSVRIAPLGGRLSVAARGDVERYAFELQPGLDGFYGSAGLELAAQPASWVRLRVAADRVFTPWLKNYLTASATLDLLLGAWHRKGSDAVFAQAAWPVALTSRVAEEAPPGLRPVAAWKSP